MLLFLRPFWKFLKRAITLDVDLDIAEGVVVLVLALSIGNKELFKETWRWELPSKAIEKPVGEFDEVTPVSSLMARSGPLPMKRPKVRLAPVFIPLLTLTNTDGAPVREVS